MLYKSTQSTNQMNLFLNIQIHVYCTYFCKVLRWLWLLLGWQVYTCITVEVRYLWIAAVTAAYCAKSQLQLQSLYRSTFTLLISAKVLCWWWQHWCGWQVYTCITLEVRCSRNASVTAAYSCKVATAIIITASIQQLSARFRPAAASRSLTTRSLPSSLVRWSASFISVFVCALLTSFLAERSAVVMVCYLSVCCLQRECTVTRLD